MVWVVVICPLIAIGLIAGKEKKKNVVEYAKKLTTKQLFEYIEELGRKKDYVSLLAILNANFVESEIAAEKYCEILDSEKAIVFCSNLDLGSIKWRAALVGLSNHPKKKVIGYIKQIATSSIPEVRWRCYTVCGRKKWDDLVEQAKTDLGNKSRIEIPKIFESTIGQVARRYIEGVSKKGRK
jgi:hypothetical protein